MNYQLLEMANQVNTPLQAGMLLIGLLIGGILLYGFYNDGRSRSELKEILKNQENTEQQEIPATRENEEQ